MPLLSNFKRNFSLILSAHLVNVNNTIFSHHINSRLCAIIQSLINKITLHKYIDYLQMYLFSCINGFILFIIIYK